MNTWQPSAPLKNLQLRAEMNKRIRLYFEERNVLEVDVPLLCQSATVDPHIESLSTQVMGKPYYLQTSPEFFLKRLLAAGSGDIYSLGKAFRQGEKGRKHQPEFTMLEWYRQSWTEIQLIEEVIELIEYTLQQSFTVSYFDYRDLFLRYLNLDPHSCSIDELRDCASEHIESDYQTDSKDDWLNLLLSHVIEPQLPQHILVIKNFPASQAVLAQTGLNHEGQAIARRFEIYLGGMELANGYYELRDAVEQERRFQQDLAYRKQNNLSQLPYDKQLIHALEAGLPECAGVALGLDRLMMILCNTDKISDVISFGH